MSPGVAPRLTVVVPGFNEEANIPTVAEACRKALERAGISNYELLLVNDGSTDRSRAAMELLAATDPRIHVFSHAVNRGMGAALKTGLKNSHGDIVTWVPGDGQFDLADVLSAALPLMDGCDVALALRTGTPRSWRVIITFTLHTLIRLLFGFDPHDMCGIFVARQAALREIKPQSDNVFFTVEFAVLSVKAGKRIGNFPIPYRARLSGVSKVGNLRTYLRNFGEMLAVWLRK